MFVFPKWKTDQISSFLVFELADEKRRKSEGGKRIALEWVKNFVFINFLRL